MRPESLIICAVTPVNQKTTSSDPVDFACNRFITGLGIVFIAAVLLLGGCARTSKPGINSNGDLQFDRILVVPFQSTGTVSSESACLRCPVCGQLYRSGSVPETTVEMMSQQLISWLTMSANAEIAMPLDPNPINIPPTGCHETSPGTVERFVKAGRLAGADAVVVGYLFRFDDRVGSDYAASQTASVAFDLHLIEVASGDILWKASLDETQKPLSENLINIHLFIKRRGRWVTASEMAREGLVAMLEAHMQP